ncbi:MAG: response regulator transcription factor [Chloroflexi bacterium]|nr:response regulator transcription factor [Chloroflexota bacterium]
MSDRVAAEPLNRTVLIVEDDPAIGHMMKTLLTVEGYRPVLVTDGQEALDVARDVQPALITLDLSLPTMNGAEVLERLDDYVPERVPVVIVSAYTDELTAEQRARVTAIVEKPFEIDALVACIDAALAGA